MISNFFGNSFFCILFSFFYSVRIMTLHAFIHRISNASLLSEEDRQYFLDNAEGYTSDARQKMVDILTKHEDEYLEFAEHVTEESRKAMQENLSSMMRDHEKVHEEEIKEADAQLEKDIKLL